MNRKQIINGSINSTILKLSWPMVVAFLLHTSFNIVDGIFVGRLSAEALAAVSISYPIIFLMIALASGLGVGTTSIIARSIGAKDHKKANNVAEHSVILAILFSIIFTAGGLLLGKSLFGLIGADTSLLNLVLDYSNIIFAGSIFMFLAFIANNILRGEGNMKVPMYVMGGSAILNIILDPIFIFVLGWGVKGAAFATVVSRFVSCIAVFIYIFHDHTIIRFNFKYFRYSFKIIKEILFIGIPSSLSQIIGSLSLFILTAIIAKFGSEAIAAFGIIFRVEGLAFMPIIGLMTALITFVGQNYGAGKLKRVKKAIFNSSVMAAAFTLFIGTLFFLFSKQIALLFNNSPQVINYVSLYFLVTFLTYPFVAIIFTIIAYFLGIGKPIPPLTLNLLRLLIITVPLAYILSLYYQVLGIWIALAIASFLSGIIAIIWYKVYGIKK